MTAQGRADWLAAFQARFGAMVRTELDRKTGTLRATPSAYDSTLKSETLPGPSISALERLAVYNRQYWFRLFGVLQSAFPLTTRLFGHWRFNEHAARFLLAHPPRGWDIDASATGLDEFLSTTLAATHERAALIEAARIDATFRRVFQAPATAPYRPSEADIPRLLESRLRPSPAAAVVEEHWPLCRLRRDLGDDPSEAPVPLPPRLDEAQYWAVFRVPGKMGQLPLEPREAELFTLLGLHAVSEALARLEASCTEEERTQLPAKTRKWLARSVELGFWSGLDDVSGPGAS